LQPNNHSLKFSVKKINQFLLFKLPSAYFTGVRLVLLEENSAVVQVKHRWINQNPFQSLYYGVQAMAAELSTGILVLRDVEASKKKISMLVTKQTASFTKKGRGVVRFTCKDADKIKAAIAQTIKTGAGQVINLQSQGLDEQGDQVSVFNFEWSIKIKS